MSSQGKFHSWTLDEKKAFIKEKNEKKKQGIIESLEMLFSQADKLGLWFHCVDNKLTCSPRQLRELHLKGIHRHSNWILIDPHQEIENLNKQIDKLNTAISFYTDEINKGDK